MLNSVHTLSSQFTPVFKESISYVLSDLQKRIALVAFAAIALLTICYLAVRHYRKHKELDAETDGSKDDIKTEEIKATSLTEDEKANEALFLKAMHLMFHDSDEMGRWVDPLPAKQQKKRHEELKKVILALPSKYVNSTTIYRDKMMGREQTLLLQAIIQIKDPDQRLEIVTMLLDKGADPQQSGFYYTVVTPKEEADDTKDAKLIALIQAAIDKMKTDGPTDEKAPETKADVPADKKEPETKAHVPADKKEPETKAHVPADKKEPETKAHVPADKKEPETKTHVPADKKEPETKAHVPADKKEPETKAHVPADKKEPETKAHVPADKKAPETTIKAVGVSSMVETKVSPLTEEEEEAAGKLFVKAMELMFQDRTIKGGLLTLSVKQQTERYEELQKAISALPTSFIDMKLPYPDAKKTRMQTLLLQAIMHIKDPAQRLDIVKMLLNKKANPHMEGQYDGKFISTQSEAETTGDVELINLIKTAKDEYRDSDT